MPHKTKEHFALIGRPLGHSLSPQIHEAIFRSLGIDADYTLCELAPEELAEAVPQLLEQKHGFNCTIPYKKALIPFFSDLDETAARCGAVNTVYKRRGYNTDAAGFLANGFDYKEARVLVLGSGGVAQTMISCVAEAGARAIVIQSRRPEQLTGQLQELAALYPHCSFQAVAAASEAQGPFHYILNGTPVGMWPHGGELPLPRALYLRLLHAPEMQAVFDAIYNPAATRFVLLARSAGVRAEGGLKMLFHQALEAEKIWHPELAAAFRRPDVIRKLAEAEAGLALRLFHEFPQKIVFTGFMASGKSTAARALAEALGLPEAFVDLDSYIEEKSGLSISELFAEQGEACFRQLEQKALAEVLAQERSIILAAGGGTLLNPGAAELVRACGGQIIALEVSLEAVLARTKGSDTRPLLRKSHKEVKALYNRRREQYSALADLSVEADLSREDCLQFILRQLAAELPAEEEDKPCSRPDEAGE